MFEFTPELMQAFQDELDKEAGALDRIGAALAPRAAGIGAGMGVGALAGGLGGAGLGGVRGYREAKEQGASTGQALVHGLGGAAGGVMKGVSTGALVGAGAGALSGRYGKGLADKLTSMGSEKDFGWRILGRPADIIGGAARSGQRQVHSLTGWTPEGGLESIRGGAYGAKKHLSEAKDAWDAASSSLESVPVKGAGKRTTTQVLDPKNLEKQEKARKNYELAQKHVDAVNKSVGHGMTSLPGMYGAMKGPNRWDAIKAGVGAGWHGDTQNMKALNVALPIAFGAQAIASAPEGERGETTGREAAMAAAGLMSPVTVMPFVGGQVLARSASAVGRGIGKGADALHRRRTMSGLPTVTQVPGTEGGDSGNSPLGVERHFSNSALGRPPEGMGI